MWGLKVSKLTCHDVVVGRLMMIPICMKSSCCTTLMNEWNIWKQTMKATERTNGIRCFGETNTKKKIKIEKHRHINAISEWSGRALEMQNVIHWHTNTAGQKLQVTYFNDYLEAETTDRNDANTCETDSIGFVCVIVSTGLFAVKYFPNKSRMFYMCITFSDILSYFSFLHVIAVVVWMKRMDEGEGRWRSEREHEPIMAPTIGTGTNMVWALSYSAFT